MQFPTYLLGIAALLPLRYRETCHDDRAHAQSQQTSLRHMSSQRSGV